MAIKNIKLFDSSGRLVGSGDYSLVDDYELTLEAQKLSSGAYFLKIVTKKYHLTEKLVLLK